MTSPWPALSDAHACLKSSRTTLPTLIPPPYLASSTRVANPNPSLKMSPKISWLRKMKRNNFHQNTISRRPSLLISPISDRDAIARKLRRDWIRRKIFRIGSTIVQSAVRWNVCPSSLIQRRRFASLRLSSPSGVTSDYLIYKAEVRYKLSKDIQVKIRDIRSRLSIDIVAIEKKLSLKGRPKATIYIEDIAEFARDLKLILVRDPNRGRPRLFIYLRPEFTKIFLSEKELNTFPIPEIIFDPTLVLSPYIFLLGILFRISAFKSLSKDSPIIDYPKKLYRLRILDGLVLREANSIQIVLEKELTRLWLRYRIKRGSEITSFAEVAKLYCLRYSVAKAFNDSLGVRRYPTAEWRLFPNNPQAVEGLRESKAITKREGMPVIDSERQLSGKVVNEEVIGALQRTGYITPQYITLIDSVLTLPGTTVEKEYKRRIATINAVIAVCDTEEGAPSRPRAPQKRTADTTDILPTAPFPKSGDTFSKAIASVCVKCPGDRPTICFICLSNNRLLERERLKIYKNPGSLSRHFVNKYIKLFPNDIHCECNIYGEKLMSKSGLLNHLLA
ncbi:hypothetical protein N7445_002520 [Penicillium cf. griseofulvum]|nr:hypothetical protein N7445_002520 [Penicillium cf. griseofulvum]